MEKEQFATPAYPEAESSIGSEKPDLVQPSEENLVLGEQKEEEGAAAEGMLQAEKSLWERLTGRAKKAAQILLAVSAFSAGTGVFNKAEAGSIEGQVRAEATYSDRKPFPKLELQEQIKRSVEFLDALQKLDNDPRFKGNFVVTQNAAKQAVVNFLKEMAGKTPVDSLSAKDLWQHYMDLKQLTGHYELEKKKAAGQEVKSYPLDQDFDAFKERSNSSYSLQAIDIVGDRLVDLLDDPDPKKAENTYF